MKTLTEFKRKYKKEEVRVCVKSMEYWCFTIDEAIKELRKIKKQYKGQIVKMELESEYGYRDDNYPSIGFYIRRKETEKEFDKRVQQAYDWYVRNEEHDLKIYQKMKKKLEG